MLEYVLDIAKQHSNASSQDTQAMIQSSFRAMREYEERLIEPLVKFLQSKHNTGVRIVGPNTHLNRAPTVAFVVIDEQASRPGQIKKRLSSKSIVQQIDQSGTVSVSRPFHKDPPTDESYFASFRSLFATAPFTPCV